MTEKMILTILTVFAAAVLTALLRSRWERRQLETVCYRVSGTGRDKFRVAFLSDLHDYCRDYGMDGLLAALRAASPDLVLLGGDMFTCQRSAGWFAEIGPSSELIRMIAGEYTVIYAEGNHETRLRKRHPDEFAAFRGRLEDAGIIYLINETVLLDGIAIHGISLDETYYRHLFPGFGRKIPMPRDLILKQLGMQARDRFNILLMHSPLYLEEASEWGADLVLSGHFHGGTIRLPLPGHPGLMTPQYQFFLKECSGMHESRNGRSKMIVSRGLGTHSVDLRLNDLPEISIIELT